jgi:hypothetical protein
MDGRARVSGDWSDKEVRAVVRVYFDMLDLELRGQPFVKVRYNEQLREETGRSKGSIEFKLQNVSAVLREVGLPWIGGYKPMANYQGKLIDAVGESLDARNAMADLARPREVVALAEEAVLYLEPPPIRTAPTERLPGALRRMVRKFDPAARDARNRFLGKQGEERVLNSERARLSQQGREDLARKVRWVAQEDGDGAGYDILSFSQTGEERLIEVKTTPGHQATPFYISANELELSLERADAFRLVRVYNFVLRPRAFELVPPLAEQLALAPTEFRASF